MQKSLQTAEVALTILALQERLETVRQNELQRVSRRQVSFRPEQQDAIEELTRSIVTRILRGPVKALKTASDNKEPAALLSMVHRIFNLGDEPADPTPQGNPFHKASNCPRSHDRAAGSEATVVPANQKRGSPAAN